MLHFCGMRCDSPYHAGLVSSAVTVMLKRLCRTPFSLFALHLVRLSCSYGLCLTTDLVDFARIVGFSYH